MRRTLLLVDFRNLLWKSVSVNGHLSHEGVFTGGLYGWVSSVCKVMSLVMPDRVIVCNDTPPYLRHEAFPAFKEDRYTATKKRPADEAILRKIDLSAQQVINFLRESGMYYWAVPGFEADDLICSVAMRQGDRYDRIVIASSDSDLYQLFLEPGGEVIQLWRGAQKGFYGRDQFVDEHDRGEEWTSEMWVRYLALQGTHNNIPGIKGVGPKTAAKIVMDPDAWDAAYAEHRDLLDRNQELIRLPHPLTEDVRIPRKRARKNFDVRVAMRFLGDHGITVTGTMREALEDLHL